VYREGGRSCAPSPSTPPLPPSLYICAVLWPLSCIPYEQLICFQCTHLISPLTHILSLLSHTSYLCSPLTRTLSLLSRASYQSSPLTHTLSLLSTHTHRISPLARIFISPLIFPTHTSYVSRDIALCNPFSHMISLFATLSHTSDLS